MISQDLMMMEFAKLNAKLDVLIGLMGGGAVKVPEVQASGGAMSAAQLFFKQFTAKQNAALQMILRGSENQEIAERLGVTENTAKVHVRVIAKKLGVNNRVQIAMRASPYFQEVGDDEYRVVTGGLPKDWDRGYQKPDPWEHVYRKVEAGEEEVSE